MSRLELEQFLCVDTPQIVCDDVHEVHEVQARMHASLGEGPSCSISDVTAQFTVLAHLPIVDGRGEKNN